MDSLSGKKWVYIASPYTKGDTGMNVRFQLTVWDVLLEMGCVPIAPLWSHFQHMHMPRKYEDWVTYDNEIIKRCDIILRLDACVRDDHGKVWYEQSESSGADEEAKLALSLGKIVVYSLAELRAYMGVNK